MSGHSKWSTIKRKKAAIDAKRGKAFTRLLREVTIAARLGGGDAEGNPRLRAAIQDARSNNVPGANIDRAIKKGLGDLDGGALDEILYEGYGPHGVAVLVETMTDNKNRTVGEVRHIFAKYGGNLGENGCVGWMFEQQGCFQLEAGCLDEEALMELALDLEIDDFSEGPEGIELYSPADRYAAVREALDERGLPVVGSELARIPSNQADLTPQQGPSVERFLDALEDLDDVQNVWSNYESDGDSD